MNNAGELDSKSKHRCSVDLYSETGVTSYKKMQSDCV